MEGGNGTKAKEHKVSVGDSAIPEGFGLPDKRIGGFLMMQSGFAGVGGRNDQWERCTSMYVCLSVCMYICMYGVLGMYVATLCPESELSSFLPLPSAVFYSQTDGRHNVPSYRNTLQSDLLAFTTPRCTVRWTGHTDSDHILNNSTKNKVFYIGLPRYVPSSYYTQ